MRSTAMVCIVGGLVALGDGARAQVPGDGTGYFLGAASSVVTGDGTGYFRNVAPAAPPTVVAAPRPAVATIDPWLLPYAFGGPWGSWLGSPMTTWGRAPSPYRPWGAFAAPWWGGRWLDIPARQRSIR